MSNFIQYNSQLELQLQNGKIPMDIQTIPDNILAQLMIELKTKEIRQWNCKNKNLITKENAYFILQKRAYNYSMDQYVINVSIGKREIFCKNKTHIKLISVTCVVFKDHVLT